MAPAPANPTPFPHILALPVAAGAPLAVPTPLRFHGIFTPRGVLDSAHYFTRYTTDYMLEWTDPTVLVQQFMAARFKGEGEKLGVNVRGEWRVWRVVCMVCMVCMACCVWCEWCIW